MDAAALHAILKTAGNTPLTNIAAEIAICLECAQVQVLELPQGTLYQFDASSDNSKLSVRGALRLSFFWAWPRSIGTQSRDLLHVGWTVAALLVVWVGGGGEGSEFAALGPAQRAATSTQRRAGVHTVVESAFFKNRCAHAHGEKSAVTRGCGAHTWSERVVR